MEVYYNGAVNPRTGAIIHPGNVPGSETSNRVAAGFAFNIDSPYNTYKEPAFDSLFKWVFGKNWNWRKFDFDQDIETVDTVLAGDLNALDENKITDDGNKKAELQKFKDRGGKLILYAGWADPLIPPPVTINYFNAVTKTMFGNLSPEAVRKTQEFTRLFMAPGMWHCGISIAAGPGPNAFGGMLQQPAPTFDPQHDLLSALTQWVEQGVAPSSVIATKYKDDQPPTVAMQRPIWFFLKSLATMGLANPTIRTVLSVWTLILLTTIIKCRRRYMRRKHPKRSEGGAWRGGAFQAGTSSARRYQSVDKQVNSPGPPHWVRHWAAIGTVSNVAFRLCDEAKPGHRARLRHARHYRL